MKWIEIKDAADTSEHGGYNGKTIEETEVMAVAGGSIVKVSRLVQTGGGLSTSVALVFVPGLSVAEPEAAEPAAEGA